MLSIFSIEGIKESTLSWMSFIDCCRFVNISKILCFQFMSSSPCSVAGLCASCAMTEIGISTCRGGLKVALLGKSSLILDILQQVKMFSAKLKLRPSSSSFGLIEARIS